MACGVATLGALIAAGPVAAPIRYSGSGLAKYRAQRERVHGPLLRRCDAGWLDAGPKARRHATAQSDLGRNQIKLFRKARVLGAVRLAVRDGISMVRRVEEA